jgi:hypothetical protein
MMPLVTDNRVTGSKEFYMAVGSEDMNIEHYFLSD